MNERIVIDPEIQQGKLIIRGTRVPVARIVCGLAGGMTMEEVIREYDISDSNLLGTFTLEALGLTLDPLQRELKPLPMILAGYQSNS